MRKTKHDLEFIRNFGHINWIDVSDIDDYIEKLKRENRLSTQTTLNDYGIEL